jgi:hypothetical protein
MTWPVTQKNHIPTDRDLCFFIVLFAFTAAVLLSQRIGAGGWLGPSSLRAKQSIFPSLVYKKNVQLGFC